MARTYFFAIKIRFDRGTRYCKNESDAPILFSRRSQAMNYIRLKLKPCGVHKAWIQEVVVEEVGTTAHEEAAALSGGQP